MAPTGSARAGGRPGRCVFRGNRFVGRHEDRRRRTNALAAATAPQPMRFTDWPGPQFDPRQPENFEAYLEAHRTWMLRLMERQFGRQPQLLAGE